ncbi:MAG: hypothetical protein JWN14_2746 [Chthonomonadales bacterium]|nr:hypothetical protein [Chthonomonadales bacterium]
MRIFPFLSLARRIGQISEPASETASQPMSVEAWLVQNDILLRKKQEPNPADAALNEIAQYWGDNKYHLIKMRKQLNWAALHKESAEVFLNKATEKEISCSRTLAQKLYDCAYASHVHYDPTTKTLSLQLTDVTDVVRYMTGGWFERYAKLQIEQVATRLGLSHDILMNAEIVLPNHQAYEIDVLFMANDKPFWIECKTGDFRSELQRICTKKRHMGIPGAQAILAVFDIQDSDAAAIMATHGMCTVGSHLLIEFLSKVLGTFDRPSNLLAAS